MLNKHKLSVASMPKSLVRLHMRRMNERIIKYDRLTSEDIGMEILMLESKNDIAELLSPVVSMLNATLIFGGLYYAIDQYSMCLYDKAVMKHPIPDVIVDSNTIKMHFVIAMFALSCALVSLFLMLMFILKYRSRLTDISALNIISNDRHKEAP